MTTLPALPTVGSTNWYGWAQGLHNVAVKTNTTVADDGSVVLPQLAADPSVPGVSGSVEVYKKSNSGLYVQGVSGVRRLTYHWGSGTTAPTSPILGDGFFHTTLGELYYDGSIWRQVETLTVANTTARDALNTLSTWLYAGFRVRVTASSNIYRWNGTGWTKAAGAPEIVLSTQGAGINSATQAAPGAGYITLVSQLIPAHTPGLLEIQCQVAVAAAANMAATYQIDYPVGSSVPGSTGRVHDNAQNNTTQYATAQGYIVTDGTSKTASFRLNNDAGSGANVFVVTGAFFNVWLHGAG